MASLTWNTDDVVKWLARIELTNYSDVFKQNDIDGRALMALQTTGSLQTTISTFADLQELGVVSIGHRRRLAQEIEVLRSNPDASVPESVAVAFGVSSPKPDLLVRIPPHEVAANNILDAPKDSPLMAQASALVTSMRAGMLTAYSSTPSDGALDQVLSKPERILQAVRRLACSKTPAVRRAASEILAPLCHAGTHSQALVNTGVVDAMADIVRNADVNKEEDEQHINRMLLLVGTSMLDLCSDADDQLIALIARHFSIHMAVWFTRVPKEAPRHIEGVKLLKLFASVAGTLDAEQSSALFASRTLRTLAGHSRSLASSPELRELAATTLDSLVTTRSFEALGKSLGANMQIDIINTALALASYSTSQPSLLGCTAHLLSTVWNGSGDVGIRSTCLNALIELIGEASSHPDAREPVARAVSQVLSSDSTAFRRVMVEEGLLTILGCRLRGGSAQEVRDAASIIAELTDDPDIQRAVVQSHLIVPLVRLAIKASVDVVTRSEALRALGNLMPVYSDRIALLGGLGAVLNMCQSEENMPHRIVCEAARVLARITASAESLLTLQWHEPTIQGPPPSARCGHSGVIWQDMFIVFGGEERPRDESVPSSGGAKANAGKPARLFADLNVLDLPSMTWRHVESHPPATPTVVAPTVTPTAEEGDIGCGVADGAPAQEEQEVTAVDDQPNEGTMRPTPRTRHSAIVVGNHMYVFGGFGLGSDGLWCLLNELLVLDLETWTWTRPKVHGKPPSPRSGHASARLGSKEILVFGGWGSPHLKYNDIHVLNVETLTWAEPRFNGHLPDPSEGAAMVTLRPSHCALVFGGASSTQSHSAIGLYDVRTLQVQRIDPGAGWPTPRAGHSFHRVGINHLLAFGGWDSANDTKTNGLAVLDTTLLRWEHPDVEGHSPSPRSLFASGVWRGGLVLFGGSDARAQGLADVHVLRIERALKHEVGRAMTGGETATIVNAIIALARYQHKPAYRYIRMAVENIGSTEATIGLSVERAVREASIDTDILPSSTHRPDPLTHLYVPASVNTTMVIPSGGRHDVQMEVKEGVARSMIVWGLHVDSYDVEVAVLRRVGESDWDEVFRHRFGTQVGMLQGQVELSTPGTYLFRLDNTYSWFTQKLVTYR